MTYFVVDIEADGPIPADYSMVCFGAVLVDDNLDRTFYGQLRPISDNWIPEALRVSGFSREETLAFDDPAEVMAGFKDWIAENTTGRPMFISDNNGFDWQFINWYFHHFLGDNPFGFSSTNRVYPASQNDHYKAIENGSGQGTVCRTCWWHGQGLERHHGPFQGSEHTVFQGLGDPQTRADVVAPS